MHFIKSNFFQVNKFKWIGTLIIITIIVYVELIDHWNKIFSLIRLIYIFLQYL